MKEKDTSNNESEDAGPSNTEDWVVQSKDALLNIETLEKYLFYPIKINVTYLVNSLKILKKIFFIFSLKSVFTIYITNLLSDIIIYDDGFLAMTTCMIPIVMSIEKIK